MSLAVGKRLRRMAMTGHGQASSRRLRLQRETSDGMMGRTARVQMTTEDGDDLIQVCRRHAVQ